MGNMSELDAMVQRLDALYTAVDESIAAMVCVLDGNHAKAKVHTEKAQAIIDEYGLPAVEAHEEPADVEVHEEPADVDSD